MSHGRRPEESERIYTRRFWLAFAANVMLVTANALTFRFAEFVRFLGGSEETTGVIVSVGLVGSLFFRAFLGQALDQLGIRKIWIVCSLINITGSALVLTAPDVGIQIYAARIIFVIGLSGMFASSVSHIQHLAPLSRRTEVIGTFGASGFVGMICGTNLGDLIFHLYPESRQLYHVLFGISLLASVLHMCLAIWLTRSERHETPSFTPPIHKLMMRYWPHRVFLVTFMMGMGFAVTMTFLTRYSTELGLSGIRTFFTAYAVTAFTVRLVARQWSRTVGRHRLICMGLLGHAIGHLLMTFVTTDWQFIPPAMCLGFGHALLFPCVVSMGAGAFPEQYRGTGTTVTLAAIDSGTILTAPVLGWIIDHFGFFAMFYFVSGSLLVGAVSYLALTSKLVDSDIDIKTKSESQETPRAAKVLEPVQVTSKEPARVRP
ncbi:MFS transporter [Thalassoglobus polymorphus]|uniref:Major facilitator superfamily transporter n=1 Tax=Thalassoglobus polymorphus TaxID=2527994 RepID=A0A517QHZ7_9PLAN|nr:MFS transporter [Thalassoglobus polymorphus]QDT31187.1 major facilitator superfamily transporter [Thalassoglobus polymorphus]